MRFLLLTIITLSLTGFSAWAEEDRTAGTKPEGQEPKSYSDTYRQLNLFGDVFERVRAQYVDEIPDEELIEKAINGMLAGLDPHSAYLDDDRFADMQIQTKGEFGGLGIEITMENGLVKVVSPIDDTPAFRAGIEAGDLIVQIDEEPVMGMTLSEAVDLMRGKVGTDIDIMVRREGEAKPLEFTITRDIIRIRAVRHRTEGNAGYIRITTFNQNTEDGVEKAIEEIEEELGEDLAGYVLDLRNNPGGLLDQAIAVADMFLERGEIVSTKGRHKRDTKRDNAHSGDDAEGLPIVVLINGGSASASEIVAGALQDHKRAIILGTKSFGKGSVQTVIPLPGHGAMRLTTARYYTPSGRSIQAKGIEPDIIVEPAKVETLSFKRVSENDLRGALDKTEEEKPEEKNKAKNKAKNEDKDDPKKEGKRESEDKEAKADEDEEIVDYQLSRALDLLSGLSLYKNNIVMERDILQHSKESGSAESKEESEQ